MGGSSGEWPSKPKAMSSNPVTAERKREREKERERASVALFQTAIPTLKSLMATILANPIALWESFFFSFRP
jgi:hypothetical protein